MGLHSYKVVFPLLCRLMVRSWWSPLAVVPCRRTNWTTPQGWKTMLPTVHLLWRLSTTSRCFCPLPATSMWDRRPQHRPLSHILYTYACTEIQSLIKCFIGIKTTLCFISLAQPCLHKDSPTHTSATSLNYTTPAFKSTAAVELPTNHIFFKHNDTLHVLQVTS